MRRPHHPAGPAIAPPRGAPRPRRPRHVPPTAPARRSTTITPPRARAALRLLATTILLPLALAALGLWEVQRGAADRHAEELRRAQAAKSVAVLESRAADPAARFQRDGRTYAGPLALQQAREELADAENNLVLAEVRRHLPPLVLYPAAATAALSALVLLAGALLARWGRASREALARGFSLVRRALPPVLGAQVVLFAIAAIAATAFEASALLFAQDLSGGGAKLLLLALLFMGVCLWIAGSAVLGLRRALTAFQPDPLPILGRRVAREDAPGLWRLLDSLAERLGALRPDDVVVGLTGGFFVASGPKTLDPGGTALTGRTLHVPLPLLPLLREDEVAAVLAHELAHFSGGDTEYSLRFLPIYAGVGRSLDALEAAGGEGSNPLLLRPALNLGAFVLDGFHRAVRHWSRLRELAADEAAARATSPDAAARALLRTAAAHPRIAETLSDAANDPDAAPDDLVAATLRRAAAQGLDDPSANLEESQPHPTDTHPPTRQRLQALGFDPTRPLLAGAAAPPAPDDRLHAYFADPGAIARAATADLLALVRRDAAAFRQDLEAAVAEVETGERALTENVRPGAILLFVMGAIFAAMGIALPLLDPAATDIVERWVLPGIGIGLGLGFLALGAWVLRRADRPYAVLRPDSLVIPGLDLPIAWADVMHLGMAAYGARVTTTLHLTPAAPFPARVSRPCRAKLDRHRRTVALSAGLPKGMKLQAFADLIGSYRRAALARHLLAEQEAPRPAPGSDWIA